MQANVGITGEAGTISALRVHGFRETQRTGLARNIIGTRLFNLSSFSLAHITHMRKSRPCDQDCILAYSQLKALAVNGAGRPVDLGHVLA